MNFTQQVYKGKNNWWRYILAFLFIIFGWQVIGILPITITAFLHAENIETFFDAANQNFTGLGINANLYLFLLLLTFFIGLLFLFVAIKSFHKRPFLSALTSRKKFDWNRYFFAFAFWAILSILFMIVDFAMHPQDFIWNFKPVPFLLLTVISLIFIPFQTSFEEILFRGYYLQGMGFLFKNRWIPLILTSVIFGLLHSFNPEVARIGSILMIYYIGTGFLFGIVALMDEGLELSMGFHAANNAVTAIFVTTNWSVFQTDALLVDTSEPNLNMLMYVPLLLIYPMILLVVAKKYRWKNWRERLTGSVKEP